jgi:hypothetical protein
MENLWNRVELLSGKTLETIRGQRFDIVEVDRSSLNAAVVIIPASTGVRSPIARNSFERGESLGLGKAVRSIDVKRAAAYEWNPIYVSAILREAAPDIEKTSALAPRVEAA